MVVKVIYWAKCATGRNSGQIYYNTFFYVTIYNDTQCNVLGNVLEARQIDILSNLFYHYLLYKHTQDDLLYNHTQ